MAGPLLVTDAPHLLYRAFFGLPDSIKGADGRPVNALLGSVNQTLWCIERWKPRAVVMCFGAEAAIYRTDLYPAYHAHRPEMPDDLAHQWALAPDLYRALGWYVVDSAELEADDMMGSLVADEEEAGGNALILSGDRDMFQCVTERVHLVLQQRGGLPEELDPAGVRKRYGIDPGQVPDFIALRGDPSDGLPGAKGIGEKTAAELLNEHGDLETAIDRGVRDRRATVRKALHGQADELRSFKDIATLRRVEMEAIADRETDGPGGAKAAEALGMKRLAERLASM